MLKYETLRTITHETVWWNDHEDKNCKSEPGQYLKENPTHKFTWTITRNARENLRRLRILEAYFTKTICPTLNDELDNYILTIFMNFYFFVSKTWLILWITYTWKVIILVIVDRDHKRWAIILNHSSKFRTIKSVVHTSLMGCNIKNRATLQKFREITNLR